MSIGYVAGLEKNRKVQSTKAEKQKAKTVKKTTKKDKVEEFD